VDNNVNHKVKISGVGPQISTLDEARSRSVVQSVSTDTAFTRGASSYSVMKKALTELKTDTERKGGEDYSARATPLNKLNLFKDKKA